MRSTRSMIRAAQTSASLRVRGRRGAGMAVLADRHRVVPDLRLRAGHDADLLGLALQDRPLLDMQLEIGIRLERRGGFGAAIADAVQRGSAPTRPRCRSGHRPCPGRTRPAQTPEPIRLWPNRLPSSSVQLISSSGASVSMPRSFRLRITSSPAMHAQRAVELAAAGLAVEVAAEQHRQPRRVAARPAGEHVADRVDPDGQAQRLAFGAEPVARRACRRRSGSAGARRLSASRRSRRTPSGCPRGVCRRCVDWSVADLSDPCGGILPSRPASCKPACA